MPATSQSWTPLPASERQPALDLLRGLALLGVLLVNLLTDFRVSLFTHFFHFHTHPGLANTVVDWMTCVLFEFKAFTLFTLLFGVGLAIQADRAQARGLPVHRFFFRRFLVLLGLGLIHLVLVWNGDILCLYAVCGLLLVPILKWPDKFLLGLALVLITLTFLPLYDGLYPSEQALRAHALAATRIYAQGGWVEILQLRWRETRHFMAPLLLGSLPKTMGLILCGFLAWRRGLVQCPERHRSLLITIAVGLGTLGLFATLALVTYAETGQPPALSSAWLEPLSYIPLALAYGAALLLAGRGASALAGGRLVASAGRMALTHYLAQSMILSLIFYGYGLGLYGKLAPAPTLLLGLILYGVQLFLGHWWLRHYRFGPVEWLWRSLTYGRWQPWRGGVGEQA